VYVLVINSYKLFYLHYFIPSYLTFTNRYVFKCCK